MADDKRETDGRDCNRVASDQDHAVQYLKDSAGISLDQARDLFHRFGNDRETLEREARKLRER